MTLHEALQGIKDKRRKQGQRYPLSSFLEMIVLAGMSGYFGINSIGRFVKYNSDYFITRYGLLHGAPSQTGIYNFLKDLDYNELNRVLEKWMRGQLKGEDVWVSIDGKALGSTVTNANDSKQDFKSIISMFCSSNNLVMTTKGYTSKKNYEIRRVQELIEELEIKGITMTIDALHCQKKQRKLLWWEEITM